MRAHQNITGKINFYLSGLPDVESARPYNFLCEMDKAENGLLTMNNHLTAQTDYGEIVLEEIHRYHDLFPENMISMLEDEQKSLSKYYDCFVSWRDELMATPEIFEPHDTLPETLNMAIQIAKELFDQQETLRWSMMEHNTDHHSKGEASSLSSASDIEDFFASL